MQGDHTQNSRDSRIFGPLPYGLIRGRVLWRVCICLTLYSLISRIKSVFFFFCILFGNQYGLVLIIVSNDM